METKFKIIETLEEKPKGVHLRELSRLVNTGLPNIIRYINILEKEGVIKKYKDANLIKIILKENIKTISYLKQINTERFLNLPKKVQMAITDFLNELNKPLLVLIFGSYAKGNYNESSDIDLLLVYQKVENEKYIEESAKKISLRTNTKINPIYLDYKPFEKNMLDKKHDFSKEIRTNVILLNGLEIYYPLIWRFLE